MTSTSYLICATPRSGSTLLCDLLTATGVAGRPASYFRRQSMANWAERLQIPSDDEHAYLQAVIAEGRGETGRFGLRVMWETMPELLARLSRLYPASSGDTDLLTAAFGPVTFIHLSRADKVAQAVSLVRALQSGLWHIGADGTERERGAPEAPAGYDAGMIRRIVDELEADDRAWSGWFVANAVTPLELSYDELANGPSATVRRVLEALNLDPAVADGIAPRTARLADSTSAEWVARFRAET